MHRVMLEPAAFPNASGINTTNAASASPLLPVPALPWDEEHTCMKETTGVGYAGITFTADDVPTLSGHDEAMRMR
jgi:hypothetical protein